MNLGNRLFTFFQTHRGLPFRTITVFNFLLEAALFGSLLILLMLLVRKLLRGKVGNRAVYMAWLLVAIRLLVPLALPNPMMNELRPTWSADEAARPVADQIRVRAHDALIDLSYQMRAAETRDEGRPVSPMNAGGEEYTPAMFVFDMAVYSSYGWTGKWVFFAYLAVDGAVLLYMIVQNVHFRQKLRRNRVSAMEGEQWEQYLSLCAQRKVKPIPVYYVDPLPSACLVGVIKPYIALPLNLSEAELPQVLTHEICHLKAGDPWWAALRNLCCVVHWFNPLVWIAARCVRTDCELACDERVTARMNEEERVAYAGTLVLAAAKRNAPRMSVLATGMTMTGKRLKQRVAAIVHSKKKLTWLIAVVAVLLVLVTALAFFTAEKREPSYDHQMAKAIRQYSFDGELPVRVPENVKFSPRAIASEEEALAYAKELLATPYLQGMDYPKDRYGELEISQFEGEWRVTAKEARNGFELYFDSEGHLLYWNECYPLASETYPYEYDLVREPVAAVVCQFAKDCLGIPEVGEVRIDEQRYTMEERVVIGRAMDESGNSLFFFVVEPAWMRMVTYLDYQRTTFGDGTFFSHAVKNLRDRLFAQSSITPEEMESGQFYVERLDEEAIMTTFTVAESELSSDMKEHMLSWYGQREVYDYQYLTTPYGAALPYKTKEAYLRRNDPVITRESAQRIAVTAAAHLIGTEEANIRCSTVDEYHDYGWYEAYCSHETQQGKYLLVIQIDMHDGSILQVDPAVTTGNAPLATTSLNAIPTPEAAPELATPKLLPTNTPEPLPVSPTLQPHVLMFEENGERYPLTVSYMEANPQFNDPPTDSDIPMDEAGRIAVEAVCEEFGLLYADLPNYTLVGSFLSEPQVDNNPKWWFNLHIQSTGECRYTIGVTSPGGEVVDLVGPGGGNG